MLLKKFLEADSDNLYFIKKSKSKGREDYQLDNINLINKGGDSPSYKLARLKREYGDIDKRHEGFQKHSHIGEKIITRFMQKRKKLNNENNKHTNSKIQCSRLPMYCSCCKCIKVS